GVRALPLTALDRSGDQTFFWRYQNGHALRTEIQTGVSDGTWIEVTNRRVPPSQAAPAGEESWAPIDGSEAVIRGDLSILTDGATVRVAPATSEVKVAHAGPYRVAGGGPVPTGGR